MKTPLKISLAIAHAFLIFATPLSADNPPKKDEGMHDIEYGAAPLCVPADDILIFDSGYYFVRIFDMQGHLIDQYIAYFEASSVITIPVQEQWSIQLLSSLSIL